MTKPNIRINKIIKVFNLRNKKTKLLSLNINKQDLNELKKNKFCKKYK